MPFAAQSDTMAALTPGVSSDEEVFLVSGYCLIGYNLF